MNDVIRVMENPPHSLPPSVRQKGVVEQLHWMLTGDGYHMELRRTMWTRNRRTRDERGQIIDNEVILRVTAHDYVKLATSAMYPLMHADPKGPTKEPEPAICTDHDRPLPCAECQ